MLTRVCLWQLKISWNATSSSGNVYLFSFSGTTIITRPRKKNYFQWLGKKHGDLTKCKLLTLQTHAYPSPLPPPPQFFFRGLNRTHEDVSKCKLLIAQRHADSRNRTFNRALKIYTSSRSFWGNLEFFSIRLPETLPNN